MATPTVLLLDDDANTLFALHSILERTEANVLQCEDEECALNTCRQLPAGIDVLVADVILQYSDGPAVVRKVRTLQPLMRLLFISGFSMTELVRRGLLGDGDLVPGTVEFLQKPFTPQIFLDAVSRLLPV
jgi:two-component system, cell cycle sensor histidine kinase and response regulator CckA